MKTKTERQHCLTKPKIVAVPSVGDTSPANMFIRVVFPAPLCPSRQVICPSYISNDRSAIKILKNMKLTSSSNNSLSKCFIYQKKMFYVDFLTNVWIHYLTILSVSHLKQMIDLPLTAVIVSSIPWNVFVNLFNLEKYQRHILFNILKSEFDFKMINMYHDLAQLLILMQGVSMSWEETGIAT